MFTEVFLITTDPNVSYSKLFQLHVISQIVLSILFHTLIYIGFANTISYIFLGRVLSNTTNRRLLISLILIMTGGYVARMYHVQDIYTAYNKDVVKAREHINKLFISWVFIG